ncbi:substrate-binding periplasmic protein [Alteromonas sp. P256]|uniref:substrate-binding periplasmic protein n=1 Tax=Alteromonas sp. P256 TaxID=3117399 RepID=UPI002FE34DB4
MKQICWFFLLLVIISSDSRATTDGSASELSLQEVKWGTDVWPNFTDSDGSGFYHELIAKIFAKPQFSLSVEYFPWKRTLKNLATGEIDFTGALPKTRSFYQSELPVLSEDINAISLQINQVDFRDLASQIGAYRAGYESDIFYAALPKEAKGVSVASAEQALILLQQGKIDYFVDLHSIIAPMLLKENADEKLPVKVETIGRYKLYWSFVFNERGKQLKSHFDEHIDRLRANGHLLALYKKYNLDMPDTK